MRKVLKNPLKTGITTFFRGREIIFHAKYSKLFDMDDEEQAAEYEHWKNTYQFMYDITNNLKGINDR